MLNERITVVVAAADVLALFCAYADTPTSIMASANNAKRFIRNSFYKNVKKMI
jgi:hypothetical protein